MTQRIYFEEIKAIQVDRERRQCVACVTIWIALLGVCIAFWAAPIGYAIARLMS